MGKMSLVSFGVWGNTSIYLGSFPCRYFVDEIEADITTNLLSFKLASTSYRSDGLTRPTAHWSSLLLSSPDSAGGPFAGLSRSTPNPAHREKAAGEGSPQCF